MKRLYSIILLLSFLVGTLQPILPMIEYQLHEGSVLEFFSYDKNISDKPITADYFVAQNSSSQHSSDCDNSLLNDNYYPLGINTGMVPPTFVLPNHDWLFPSIVV